MLTTTGKLLAALVTLALLCGLVIAFTGCTKLMELERNIWTPPTATEKEIEAGDTPPLLEVIAGGLATIGFAGMALWIRRNRKRSCSKADVETIVRNNNTPA